MKIIKKIIFLIQFIFFVTVKSSSEDQEKKDKETKNLYHTLLNNRYFGIPTSAIIGGGIGAGLKYLLHNNKFLSSFRAAEKIKNASYAKFFLTGGLVTVPLYELLKPFTKPKKTNDHEKSIKTISSHSSPGPSENSEEIEEKRTTKDDKEQKNSYHHQENIQNLTKQQIEKEKTKSMLDSSSDSSAGLRKKSEEIKEKSPVLEEKPKIDYSKAIKVIYICPGNLYSLFESVNGLETETAKQIEDILSEGEIQKYSKNYFSLYSSEEFFRHSITQILKNFDYCAALYLINEDQKESFKDIFNKSSEKVYDLYKINKPASKENLLCYALSLESSVDKEGKKTYSLNISSEITKDNIDDYSFKLSKEDAKKIDLNANEILSLNSKFRRNKQILYE